MCLSSMSSRDATLLTPGVDSAAASFESSFEAIRQYDALQPDQLEQPATISLMTGIVCCSHTTRYRQSSQPELLLFAPQPDGIHQELVTAATTHHGRHLRYIATFPVA